MSIPVNFCFKKLQLSLFEAYWTTHFSLLTRFNVPVLKIRQKFEKNAQTLLKVEKFWDFFSLSV